MSEESRMAKREEKKREKDKKTRKILWIIIAIIVVVLVVMKLFELDLSPVKKLFSDNKDKSTVSSIAENGFPFALDSSKQVTVTKEGSKLSVLTDSSLTIFNPSTEKMLYSVVHGYSYPIMATSDSYSVTYDQGAKKLRVDSSSENIYEKTTENKILCADVADKGVVAYATLSTEKRSDVHILTSSLKEKLFYSESYGFITNIAISDNGKQVAFVAMNSSNASLVSKLFIMNIGDIEPKKTYEIKGSNVLDLQYKGNSIYVVGNNFLSVADTGKNTYVCKPATINTLAFDYTPSGELVVIYNVYSNSTEHKVIKVSSGGKINSEIEIKGNVTDISVSTNKISLLNGNKIDTYSLSNGEKKSSISCDDGTKSITRMSSYVFACRQSIIEKKEAE